MPAGRSAGGSTGGSTGRTVLLRTAAGPAPWFIGGLVAALAIPGVAPLLVPAVIPLLVALLTLALVDLPAGAFREMLSARSGRTVLRHLGLSFGLLSPLTLIAAAILTPAGPTWAGFVVMAAVPTAIAIVPVTRMLGGDVRTTVTGTLAAYLLAPVMTPALVWVFLRDQVPLLPLVVTVAEVVVLPLVLSRGLRGVAAIRSGERGRLLAMNILFALLAFAIVGVNRVALLRAPADSAPVLLVGAIRTVGALGIVALLSRGTAWPARLPELLAGSLKNLGLAAALALAVVGPAASLPAALTIPFEYVVLTILAVEHSRRSSSTARRTPPPQVS